MDKVLKVRDFFDVKSGTKHIKPNNSLINEEEQRIAFLIEKAKKLQDLKENVSIKQEKPIKSKKEMKIDTHIPTIKSFFNDKERKEIIENHIESLIKEQNTVKDESIKEHITKNEVIEEVVIPPEKKSFQETLRNVINYLPSEEDILKETKSNEKVDENVISSFISNSVSALKQMEKEKIKKEDEWDDIDILDRDNLLNILKRLQNDLVIAKRSANKISGGMGGGGSSEERHKIYDNTVKLKNRKNLNFIGFNITEDNNNDIINIENIGSSTPSQNIISININQNELEEIDIINNNFNMLKYLVYMECVDRKRSFELSILNKGNDSLIHSVYNILGDDISYNLEINEINEEIFIIIENTDVDVIKLICKKDII